MDKILVTGGTGMVGKHLQKILPEATYIGSKDCDLTNQYEVDELFSMIKPKKVIHLAAKVGGIQDNTMYPLNYYEDNILMNTILLKTSYQYGVEHFLGILSTCIYPNIASNYPMTEDMLFEGPPNPIHFGYGYAKRCLAIQIDAYNKQYGTKYSYISPCNLYSELDNFNNTSKSHFITALLKKIKESKNNTIELLGDGTPLRQFMYAGDLAFFIKKVIEENITKNYNIAPPENLSINEMAKRTLKILNLNYTIKYTQPHLTGQHRKDVDCTKLFSDFPDFEFTNFNEGIKKVYNELSKQY